MFDWDDEQLANVIWDEAGENEDHIVPYPDETYEKPSGPYGEHSKVSDQDAANVTEKTLVSITDSRVRSNIHYNTHGTVSTDGFGSLPDLSPSNATKLDLEHTDGKAQVDDGAQVFDNQPEDKEANNFVDYRWAHVGSFDDLDRILSNDDLVYGDANISNSEALWSSPKDVIGYPEKSELLSIDSPNLRLGDLKSDSHGKTNDHLCHSTTSLANLEYGGGKNENLPKEKSASEIVGRTPTLVCSIRDVNVAIPDKIATDKHVQMGEQSQKMEGQKSETRQPQTSCVPWFSLGNQGKEFEGHYRQHIKYSSSKARTQQTESSTYKQCMHPLPHSFGYKLRENQHSSLPSLPQFHSGEEYQQVPSGSSYISDRTPKTALMPTSMMTPQEKVEKLRRRQQMRALLAVRKQQQQFRHQVSCNGYSNLGKYLHESQMQFTRGGNVEIDGNLSTLMSLDGSSPLEQSDSDETTLEYTILHQLQNVISKLDIEIRLCIRDSLFRLAQSASRRQYDGDTVDANRRSRDEASVIVEERLTSTKSSARTADGETKTNPIDRAVAYMLFHTSPGEFLHSPSSPKQTTTTSTNLPTGFLSENYEDDQLSCLFEQRNKETAGGSGDEIEASSRGAPFL
ncbi:protein LNK2 [Cynara cardunculus var. scolymus]|uniref:protein LNK2 n=1 Tax=Cynara cardunculus var. scolymus TaxID=59895 RepID=UPI000D624FB0|nr:protein LNK2 [Cynara cardunculus var. scolymus]